MAVFLLIFALLHFKKTFRPRVLITLIISGIVIFMLNLWFIVPFLDSMDMDVAINKSLSQTFSILQPSGIYPLQLFNILHYADGASNPVVMMYDKPLTPGIGLLWGLAVFVYIISCRKKLDAPDDNVYRLGRTCCIIALTAIIFSFEIFPWDELNNISPMIAGFFAKTQYCWRNLCIATPCAAYVTVAALKIIKEKKALLYKITVFSTIAISVLGISSFFSDLAFNRQTYTIYSVNSINSYDVGLYEYLLNGADISLCSGRNLHIYDENVSVSDYSYEHGITEFKCTNGNSDRNAQILLPLFSYPGYKAYDKDSGEQFYIETGQNKLVMVHIPSGYSGTVVVKYIERKIWRIAELMSLVTLAAVIAYMTIAYKNVRKKKAQ